MLKKFAPVFPLFIVTGFAEWCVRHGTIPEFLLPAPSSVFMAMNSDPDAFVKALSETALAAGIGWGLSMIIGLLLALILVSHRFIKSMFYPYAIFFQTVPIIAIAPLLVIWLGYGISTVIASAFIVSVFPVIANSVMGLTRTDPLLLQLFKSMQVGRAKTLFLLKLPAALPQILGGFKISAGLSVIGAIVGEFISGSGLGGLIDTARNQQRVDRVFAAIFLASVLGVLFFASVTLMTRFFIGEKK